MTQGIASERLTLNLARAVTHWEKQQAGGSTATGKVPARWTIAISREAGAKGVSVARRVGELLSWPVYDRELLQKIADEKGLRVKLLESVDEKHTSWLQSCLTGLATGPFVSETAFVRYLVESVFSLAALGECVIVGRGAALILPPESTLRVRLIGTEKDRVAYISRHFALPQAEAEAWVKKTDQDRSWFAEEYFHKHPGDPNHYDLVLNTSRLSVECTAQLVVLALRQAETASRTTVS